MEQTEAILIRRHAWSDTSLILTWSTADYGKVQTVAKGARRAGSAFAGRLDLFHRVEIGYVLARRGDLHTLREIRLIDPFAASAAANLFLAGYFSEVVDLSTEPGQPVPEIHDLLSRGLNYLSGNPATERALVFFEVELCRLLGVLDVHGAVLNELERYCGKIPSSRNEALRLLGNS
jgi:DNA repair protein RecO (recombination protein O)